MPMRRGPTDRRSDFFKNAYELGLRFDPGLNRSNVVHNSLIQLNFADTELNKV